MRLLNYADVTSIRQTETVELFPGVTVRVQDLPPTYTNELEEMLPTPVPPKIGPLKDGGRIVKDGKVPVFEYDIDDEDYQAAVNRRNVLALVFFVTQGLAPGEAEFDTKREDHPDGAAYLTTVLDEMKAFGWGIGQVTKVANVVRRLSGITETDVEEAEADFS